MEEPMTVGIEGAMEESAEAKVVAESVTAAAEEASGTVILEDASAPGEASTASDSVLSDVRALKGILEALLFVTTEPIPTAKFVSLLGAVTRQDVERTLAELSRDYEQEGRGLQLVEVAGGYRLVTKGEFAPWLKRLEKTKAPSKLSRSALESLAIIAYKQPIVRAEVEQIRGVETSGVIRTLLERKLVRIVGRKEEPGRPIMYSTTKFFLEHFGLRDLSQLPPLREFKELGEAEQAMLPIEESVAIGGAVEPSPLAVQEEGGRTNGASDAHFETSNGAPTEIPAETVGEAGAEEALVVADIQEES